MSPMTAIRPRRAALRRVLLVTAVAVVLVIVAAPGASAHSQLLSTSPAAGSIVASPPGEIRLTFDESVEISLGAIRLYDAAGREVPVGHVRHPGGVAAQVATTPPTLQRGSYVVSWRVISADSHPVSGAFTFTVGTASDVGSDARGVVSRLLNDSGSRTVSVLFAVAKWLGLASIAVLIGSLWYILWCRRGGRLTGSGLRFMTRSVVVAIGSTVAVFVLQGPYAGGTGLGDAFRPSVWSDVATTRFGEAQLVRIGLLLLALAAIRTSARAGRTVFATSSVILSVGIAITVAVAGHGATGRWIGLGIVADVVHVLAFSVWVGGLFALLSDLRSPAIDPAQLVVAARRFSDSALVAVVAVAGSGTAQAMRQINSVGSVWSTTYGRLLLLKLGIVLAVVVVAAFSRSVTRRWAISLTSTETPAPDGGDEPVVLRGRLRRNVAIEVVGVAVVLAVSVLLSGTIPAREAVGLPFSQTVVGDGGFAEILVSPARAGSVAIHVTVTNPDGTVPDLSSLTVDLDLPERQLGPFKVPMTRYASNHYIDDRANIPFAGTWRLTVRASVGDFDSRTFVATVPVK